MLSAVAVVALATALPLARVGAAAVALVGPALVTERLVQRILEAAVEAARLVLVALVAADS